MDFMTGAIVLGFVVLNTVLSYKSDIDLFEKFITKNNFKDQTVETVVRKYITKKSVTV